MAVSPVTWRLENLFPPPHALSSEDRIAIEMVFASNDHNAAIEASGGRLSRERTETGAYLAGLRVAAALLRGH